MVAKLTKPFTADGVRGMAAVGTEHELKQLRLGRASAGRGAPAEGSRPRHSASAQAKLDNQVDRLYHALAAVTPQSHPRTAKLLGSGTRKVAQKVIEEAGEVALAAVKHNGRGVVRESADLIYQLAVLWHRIGIDPGEVWAEMRRRAETLGIAEKLPKPAS